MPFRFDWHQDGGRQNREIKTAPRPRLSVKLAYWLSDVSEPGRGNLEAAIHVTDNRHHRQAPPPLRPGFAERLRTTGC